jgi:uncharacterized protein
VYLLLALLAGALIGLSLGALGGGGSILAVPVLVYLLHQSAAQATTGSLVVVGATSLIGAIAAARSGHVLLGPGIGFGAVAIGGAALGATASTRVSDEVLLAAFAALMLIVGGLMLWRQVRHSRQDGSTAPRPLLDDPIVTFSPTFACDCPRALKLLLAATAVGLLTGFLGVGGGFLVVPALLFALSVPMHYVAGTSLVVITITSAAALVVRSGAGVNPDWDVVLTLTAGSALAAVVGARLAGRLTPAVLQVAFTGLVFAVATWTALRALPPLL